MPPFPKISVPPLSAECETITHSAQPGASPKPLPWKLFRSADGKMCADYGDKSVISNPGAQQAIMLDHLKKEASLFTMPHTPQPAPGPGGPMGTAPAPPSVSPTDLGKKFIEGHEAEGKQYIVQPPKPFSIPGVKPPAPAPVLPAGKAPTLPQLSTLAKPLMPGGAAPQAHPPAPVSLPHTVEVWTSTKLHLPLLTKVTGSFGNQTNRCKNPSVGEPPASKFQIPPGYKVVEMPKPPKPPGVPG